MSFFKDFKEDLSQAVNELLPDETSQKSPGIMDEEPQMVDTITDEEPMFAKDDIASMLESIDPTPVMANDFAADTSFGLDDIPLEKPDLSVFDDEITFTESPEVIPEIIQESEPVVFAEPTFEPMQSTEPISTPQSAPQVAEPISTPQSAPQIAEPVQETKVPVQPIFAQEPEVRPAPINTTREDLSMETGIIIAGMTIKGDIISDGNLDVRGSVTGNISIKGKLEVTGTIDGNSQAEEVFADGAQINGEVRSNGSVKIGQGAVVKGNIAATSAVLAGAVKGDIDVQGPVILDSTAIIMGNIKSKSIQINNGAVIEGLCSQCYADVSPMSFFGEDKKAK